MSLSRQSRMEMSGAYRGSRLSVVGRDLMPAILAPHKERQVGRHSVAGRRAWPR
jgi:hypothetical protein